MKAPLRKYGEESFSGGTSQTESDDRKFLIFLKRGIHRDDLAVTTILSVGEIIESDEKSEAHVIKVSRSEAVV